jgi:hypothetical protein
MMSKKRAMFWSASSAATVSVEASRASRPLSREELVQNLAGRALVGQLRVRTVSVRDERSSDRRVSPAQPQGGRAACQLLHHFPERAIPAPGAVDDRRQIGSPPDRTHV